MDLLITNDQLVLLKKILTNPRHFRQYSVSFRERTPSGSVDAKKVSVLLELAAYENGSRILQLTLEALLSLFFRVYSCIIFLTFSFSFLHLRVQPFLFLYYLMIIFYVPKLCVLRVKLSMSIL